MSIDLVAKNCDFSGLNMGFVPAVSAGLKYLNFYGVNKDRTSRNLADDSKVVVTGSPEYLPASARFTPYVNFLTTAQKQPADMTILMCVNLQKVSSSFIGTYRGTRPSADGVLSNGVRLTSAAGDGGSSQAALSFNVSQTSGVAGAATENVGASLLLHPTGWAFVSASVDATKRVALRSHTANLLQEVSLTKEKDINTTDFVIGGLKDTSTFSAPNEIAFCAIYERALSLSEKNEMYESIKKFMAVQGITI